MSVTEAYRGGLAGRPGWWLAFPYDPELIDRLKRRVPHTDRAWNAEDRRWWVAQEHEDLLAELLPGFAAHLLQGSLF